MTPSVTFSASAETPSFMAARPMSRARTSAGTGRIGLVGAEEERVDAPSGLHRGALHRVVDGDQGCRVEQAAGDSGLVGGDDDAVARLREARDRLKAAIDRPPLVRRLDEFFAVLVDRAVAIEDDKLHGRMTRFIWRAWKGRRCGSSCHATCPGSRCGYRALWHPCPS